MFNPNLSIGSPFIVRNLSAAVGTAYEAGTAFSMDSHNAIGLEVLYTKGNETSLQVKVEGSNDGGSIYVQQVAESTSGGTTTISLNERSFAASGNYSILITPVRAGLVKVSVKTTYATVATGTCVVRAYPLWV